MQIRGLKQQRVLSNRSKMWIKLLISTENNLNVTVFSLAKLWR